MKIQTKIILLIVGILVVTGILGGGLLIYHQAGAERYHYEEHTTVLASIFLASLKDDMLLDNPQHIQDEIAKMRKEPALVELLLLDAQGQVAASSERSEIGETRDDPDIREVLATGKPMVRWETTSHPTQIDILLPIANEPACYACHEANQHILGALKVGLDATSQAAHLRSQLLLLGGFILSGMVLVTGVLSLAFRTMVTRRLVRLGAVAARVGSGDYTTRSWEKGDDEIATLARSLNTMTERLSELDRRKDAFVSIASHELRTPMTSILGFSELLLTRQVPEATRQEWLQRINRESARLTNIVDDLLNVSRIQSGRITPDLQAVALRPLIGEVVAPLKLTTSSHQFEMDIPDDLPFVLADADMLTQVLVNLVDNAVKYSPQGGMVKVSAHHEPGAKQVITTVSDQGIGIAQEHLARLFTTFHRIHRPEVEHVRGTGLGLYIVKSLVELMGGEVWVESEVGRGSTFSFSVPVHRIDLAKAHPHPHRKTSP